MTSALQLVDDFVSGCRILCLENKHQSAALRAAKDLPGMNKSVSRVDAAFEACTSSQFTVIMVTLLAAKAKYAPLEDWRWYAAQVQAMVTVADSSLVALVRDMYDFVIHEVARAYMEHDKPAMGIPLIDAAIRRIQPDLRRLTPIHADLCKLCLAAKNFKPALAFMDTDIEDLAVDENGKFDAESYLLYFYYGGIIYCATKSFQRAALFFQAAMACPTSVVSAIMNEAYNHLILVSLLVDGKAPRLPRYVTTAAQQPLPIYTRLAELYVQGSVADFLRHVESNRAAFEKHSTYGLVKQVRESLFRRDILRLTKAFVTVSLADVARRANLRDADTAERYLRDMMTRGEVFGTIDQQAGAVRFHDNPEHHNSTEVAEQMEKRISDSSRTLSLLSSLARVADVNPNYLRRKLDIATQNGSSGAFAPETYTDKDDVDFNMGF